MKLAEATAERDQLRTLNCCRGHDDEMFGKPYDLYELLIVSARTSPAGSRLRAGIDAQTSPSIQPDADEDPRFAALPRHRLPEKDRDVQAQVIMALAIPLFLGNSRNSY